MLTRKWIPNNKTIESASKITIYDAGAYFCEMLGDTYKCWEVVSREKDDEGSIIEVLAPVYGDWVPFDIISAESYPVEIINGGHVITGWSITSQLQKPPSQRPQ